MLIMNNKNALSKTKNELEKEPQASGKDNWLIEKAASDQKNLLTPYSVNAVTLLE